MTGSGEQSIQGGAPVVKTVRSWSKPEGIPDLLGRKRVDWSVFVDGTAIPLEFHEDFREANGGRTRKWAPCPRILTACDGATSPESFGSVFINGFSARGYLRPISGSAPSVASVTKSCSTRRTLSPIPSPEGSPSSATGSRSALSITAPSTDSSSVYVRTTSLRFDRTSCASMPVRHWSTRSRPFTDSRFCCPEPKRFARTGNYWRCATRSFERRRSEAPSALAPNSMNTVAYFSVDTGSCTGVAYQSLPGYRRCVTSLFRRYGELFYYRYGPWGELLRLWPGVRRGIVDRRHGRRALRRRSARDRGRVFGGSCGRSVPFRTRPR